MARLIPIFDGWVNAGKLALDNREGFARRIADLEGKRIQITLEPERKNRTNLQNRYYWGVIVPYVAEHFGYRQPEHEQVHEMLKHQFLRDRTKERIDGAPYIRSTAGLDTEEFGDYCEVVRLWMLETYNVYIPLPKECNIPGMRIIPA